MNIQKGQNPYYDTTTVQTTTLTRAFRFIVEALSSYRESAKVLLPPSPFRRAAPRRAVPASHVRSSY